MKKAYFCSVAAGQTGSRHCTGQETAIFFCTSGYPTADFSGQVGGGVEAAGSPELPLAHGRTSNRTENGHPQRKAQGSVLTKKF